MRMMGVDVRAGSDEGNIALRMGRAEATLTPADDGVGMPRGVRLAFVDDHDALVSRHAVLLDQAAENPLHGVAVIALLASRPEELAPTSSLMGTQGWVTVAVSRDEDFAETGYAVEVMVAAR